MSNSKSVRITKYLAYLALTILAIIWLFRLSMLLQHLLNQGVLHEVGLICFLLLGF